MVLKIIEKLKKDNHINSVYTLIYSIHVHKTSLYKLPYNHISLNDTVDFDMGYNYVAILKKQFIKATDSWIKMGQSVFGCL